MILQETTFARTTSVFARMSLTSDVSAGTVGVIVFHPEVFV